MSNFRSCMIKAEQLMVNSRDCTLPEQRKRLEKARQIVRDAIKDHNLLIAEFGPYLQASAAIMACATRVFKSKKKVPKNEDQPVQVLGSAAYDVATELLINILTPLAKYNTFAKNGNRKRDRDMVHILTHTLAEYLRWTFIREDQSSGGLSKKARKVDELASQVTTLTRQVQFLLSRRGKIE